MEFVAGEWDAVIGLGVEVVEIAFEPARFVDDLAFVDAIGQLEQEGEGYVVCDESAGTGTAPASRLRVGVRRCRPDSSDFKGGRGELRSCDPARDEQGARQNKANEMGKPKLLSHL